MLNKIVFIFFSLILITSCSKSGTKALEQGDYYNAVLQSVSKLKKDAGNEKSLMVLPDAYLYASEDLKLAIQDAKKGDIPFRWEHILDYYTRLNIMHEEINSCTSCRRVVKTESFFDEGKQAREIAAEDRYEDGLKKLNIGTIESGRAAFFSFEKILTYHPNYKDISSKMDEALMMGSYHVIVEKTDINSRFYQISNEYFQNEIDQFLRSNRRLNRFVKFYSPSEARTSSIVADHIIRLSFVDFVVGETIIERSESTVISEDSVKTGTTTIGGEKVEVYDKVKAELSMNRKIISSRGLLAMEIRQQEGNRILLRQEFPGEFTWINEWASYNGDKRALSADELVLSQNREEIPPSQQQLFIEFSKPIYDQLTSRIRRFYRDF